MSTITAPVDPHAERWALTLDCGHTVHRWARFAEVPVVARCDECWDPMFHHVVGRYVDGPTAEQAAAAALS